MKIINGSVFLENGTFEDTNIVCNGDTIAEISTQTSDDNDVIDAKDCYVIPGLVDIHFHGCMGVDACVKSLRE